jgi:hypothetical protein
MMLTIFAVTFVYVALKALQQLQVVNYEFARVLPVSLGMALCEVTIMLSVVHDVGFWGFIPMGLGGGLGAMFSMYLHKKGR